MSDSTAWAPRPDTASRIMSGAGIWGVYGPPGSGKTIDQCRAFHSGLWIGDEYDFRSAAIALQWAPPAAYLKTDQHTFKSILDILDEMFPNNQNPKKIPSIVIDELNTVVVRSVAASQKKDGRAAYKELNEQLTRLFDRFRKLNKVGVHVAWNAHSTRPDFEEIPGKGETVIRGILEREGGPEFPGQAMRTVAKRSDCLYRLDVDPAKFNHPHPFAYFADHKVGGAHSGANFFQKDRLDLVQQGPLNLAEILRAAGFKIPRPPQIEAFLEQRVAWAVTLGTEPQMVLPQLLPVLRQPGVPDHVIMWGMNDAAARMEIMRATSLSKKLEQMFGIMGA